MKHRWKQYEVRWCDRCETAIILCDHCENSSCNGSSCERCHEDFEEFSKTKADDFTINDFEEDERISEETRLLDRIGMK